MAVDVHPLVVYVVDDNESVRDGLARLMRSAGYEVRSCTNEDEFLARADASPGCVLLALSARGAAGGSLSAHLSARGLDIALIAMSVAGDEHADREARGAGEAFLLRNPVDDRAPIDAIRWTTGGRCVPRETRRALRATRTSSRA